ncbi:hypothetical protein DL546_009430 [Coniochaeta pulveracea]|nr:hypothetical protein DL546_009430 [Coniochaeta pulveracea]
MRHKLARFISMCGTCSRNSINKEDVSPDAENAADLECLAPEQIKHSKRKRSPVPVTLEAGRSNKDMGSNQYDQVRSLDHIVATRRAVLPLGLDHGVAPSQLEDYERQRQEIKAREGALSWDYQCMEHAEDYEVRADHIIRAIRKWDEEAIYARAKEQIGYRGQRHGRFMGDHYLTNVELIEQTRLFAIAQKMPKGAHLHIHFNANLLPDVLVGIAARQKRMFIMSDRPLLVVTDPRHPEYYRNFERARIQFSILSEDRVRGREADLFDLRYPTVAKAETNGVMRFRDFLDCFGEYYRRVKNDTGETYSAVDWLCEKIVFNEQEAHGLLQTAEGSWDRFNGRTQMMKGLFNYVTAYREYTRACLQAFVDDNIQYAEIRPNFMDTNQLWTDDGVSQIDNVGIMDIIVEECESFAAELTQVKEGRKYFAGIKVIYCTPRSFTPDQVEKALQECLWFKKHRLYGEYIAGFDLVGEESKGKSLKSFIPQLLQFKRHCKAEGVEIPFLFHCGETLEIGGETDGNLYDALLLGAKRIGHGFALARHPYVMEQMKKNNICLELCPISNEILGLTPRVGGHAMYTLLANNVHCTLNTDNGTLFR